MTNFERMKETHQHLGFISLKTVKQYKLSRKELLANGMKEKTVRNYTFDKNGTPKAGKVETIYLF